MSKSGLIINALALPGEVRNNEASPPYLRNILSTIPLFPSDLPLRGKA